MNATFSYRAIPVAKCFVDLQYQREAKPSRISKMADAPDDLLLGTIEVSERRGGRYAVIVGQHRLEMLRQVGVLSFTAKVWKGLTVEQEAYIFDRQPATEKAPTAYEYFRSRLFRRDPVAVDMARIAKKAGFVFCELPR